MPVEPLLADAERQQFRERYAEIAALAGGLAHEIRNPLSTISLNLELLNEDLEQLAVPQSRRMLMRVQSVQKECHNLERILEDFLKFARAGQLALEPTDLNELVREFVRFWQPQSENAHIEVRPHLASDIPQVMADPALVRQALLNLAMNARHAMPTGGVLELQTCRRDGRVVLEIIDTGTGMDERTRGKLFEAFFSTRPGGSGLGLPTVRRIVEAHRGTISCDSEPGRGTRFTIALPAAGTPS
jgi:two-component system, NtrC family, sensor histidine kinase HydH